MSQRIRLGVENLSPEITDLLRRRRFGLLVNQASIDSSFRYVSDLLARSFGDRLAALFSPQHGLFSEQQDNMIESPHDRDRRHSVPVYSLYNETRWPTPKMLEGIEAFVIDLQDVGTRVYTFVWTALYCVEECAKRGIPVVVLDRPNPLGGQRVEGPILDPDYASFVGRAAIPMRHGLTLAELLLFLNAEWRLGAELLIAKVEGWRRDMLWPEYSDSWIPTSPNMPRFEAAMVYPGQVLIEGTKLSEGRGTTTPFELFGAPFLDPYALISELQRFELKGVVFRPIRFQPTFQKFKEESCGGLFLHVTDRQLFQPYRTTAAIFACLRNRCGKDFEWLDPPYEYEADKMPIDILSGGTKLREAIDSGSIRGPEELDDVCRCDCDAWERSVARFRLYS